MKKLLKIMLWVLAVITFVLVAGGAIIGYDLIKLRSSADDIAEMQENLTEICFRQSKESDDCRYQIMNTYLQCFSPFISDKKRSDCFEQAATSVNHEFRPELGTANKKPEDIAAWAAAAAPNIINFGYDDYEEKLNHARRYFAAKGWSSFSEALKDADMIETAKTRKLHLKLKVLGKPEIKNALVKSGIYTWFVEFPVEIDFTGENPPQPVHCVLVLQIQRVSSYESPDGIGIVQWITFDGS